MATVPGCPFCGAQALLPAAQKAPNDKFWAPGLNAWGFAVLCSSERCGAMGPLAMTPAAAIASWCERSRVRSTAQERQLPLLTAAA